MNIKKLNDAIETLKENVGAGLIACDIWASADGQSIAGYNSQPKASALFNSISLYTNRALKESGFPVIGRYNIIDLTNNKMVIVMPMGDYQWGMLIDSDKSPLGLLLNIAIPRAIAAFEEAVVG